MFKISHELPVNMLDRSFEINDYEYCLPHLLDQNEAYRKHFENAKESGSYIIMDNSLHKVHLLGCALPQEFGYYADFPFIESIDTSNPIIHGLEGVKYNSLGLLNKSSIKIDKIDKEIDTETLYDINHNLIQFKNFVQDGNTQLY